MIDFRVAGLIVVFLVAAVSWLATCAAYQFDEVAAGVRPLDARYFNHLTVVTIGTGGAYENKARLGPSTAVAIERRMLLVDAGRGVADALRAAEVPVSQPEAVLLTSLLPENTIGLDDLLFTRWLDPRSAPLLLIGPPGTAEFARLLLETHGGGLAAMGEGLGVDPPGPLDVREANDGFQIAIGGMQVVAGAMPGLPTDTLAWRIYGGDRSIVVAGPGRAGEALIEFAKGANLLVAEAVSVPEGEVAAAQLELTEAEASRLAHEAKLHTPLEAIGALAHRAGVGALALVRLRPPPVFESQYSGVVAESYGGTILIPEDGEDLVP